MRLQKLDSIDAKLYQGIISHFPGIITLLENMTLFLSNLASTTDEESVFPADLMDEFEEEMSESPRSSSSNLPYGFVHCMNKYIIQIISLENSMINILEDLIVFSEARWNLTPNVETINVVESFETDSQTSNDDETNSEIRKQREHFLELLHDFESCTNANDMYERGARIHKFLQLNKHLDIVNRFYKLVTNLRNANENFIRHNGFDLSKQRASVLLEDGEKLDGFCVRVVDKVEQYQQVIFQVNTILDLMD